MKTLKAEYITTPLGEVSIIHDKGAVVLVDFSENKPRIRRILNKYFGTVISLQKWDRTPSIVARSLKAYFEGKDNNFNEIIDHFRLLGTTFQKKVWAALMTIPYGETKSYKEIAIEIGRPKASRAVGAANGLNPVSIFYPCHRVIGANGSLTGYAGGINRKKWLLAHEKSNRGENFT